MEQEFERAQELLARYDEELRRLLDRILAEVEPDERDQPAAGALGVRERAVVRRAERRVAVGLVHAEHERVGDAVAVHEPLELVEAADHAVDVVPEVHVHVEDLGTGRQVTPELLVVRRDQRALALECLFHRFESMRRQQARPPGLSRNARAQPKRLSVGSRACPTS